MRVALLLVALLLAGCLEPAAREEASAAGPGRVRDLVLTPLPDPPVPVDPTPEPPIPVNKTPEPPTPTPPTDSAPLPPSQKAEPRPRVLLDATSKPLTFSFSIVLQTWVRDDARDLAVEATVLDEAGEPREGTVTVRAADGAVEPCPSPCAYRAADPAPGLFILGVEASGTYRLRATVTVVPALRPAEETLYAVQRTLDGEPARNDSVYVLPGYDALAVTLRLGDGAAARLVDPGGVDRLACDAAASPCEVEVGHPLAGRWTLAYSGAGAADGAVVARLAEGTQPELPDEIVVYDAWVDLEAGARWDGFTVPADYIYHGESAAFSGKSAPPQGSATVTFHTPRDTKGMYGLMRSVSSGGLGPSPTSEDGLWGVEYSGSDAATARIVVRAFLRNPM